VSAYARPSMGNAKQKADMKPLATEKEESRKQTAKDRRIAYVLVEKRDAMLCRCCGKPLVRTLERRLDKLEHHHIDGRDVGDAETTRNIVCVCRECHDERHVTRQLSISGDGDGKLRMQKGARVWFTKPPKPLSAGERRKAEAR